VATRNPGIVSLILKSALRNRLYASATEAAAKPLLLYNGMSISLKTFLKFFFNKLLKSKVQRLLKSIDFNHFYNFNCMSIESDNHRDSDRVNIDAGRVRIQWHLQA